MPKIAFLITVYKNDKLDYFKEAVESIKTQDYNFENINIYLGIDGLLPHNIRNYIDANKELFYKIIQNDINKGLSFTLNRLIDILENEEYIFRMDSDDICATNRVSLQVQKFQSDRELLLIGSDLIEIDENRNKFRYKKMPVTKKDILHYAITRCPFNHPTVAMRKDFFTIVGKYNESYFKVQDYELWARALKKNIHVSNISKPLIYFHIPNNYLHKRNSRVSRINEFKVSIDLMLHFNKYTQFPKIILKLIIRFLPFSIGNSIYKILRK